MLYKIFVRTLAIVLILAAAGASYTWDRRAQYVSSQLTDILQVDSSVKDVNFSDRVLSFANLHISTPAGSTSDTSLAATEVRLTTDWTTLFSNDVVIDELAIDSPLLGFELYSADGSENNWASIINRLNLAGSQDDATTKYMVRKVVLTNVRIHIENGRPEFAVNNPDPIERIELLGVGSESPLPSRVLLATILREVLQRAAIDPSLKDMVNNIKPLPYDVRVNGIVFPAFGKGEPHALVEDRVHVLERDLRALMQSSQDAAR